MLKEYDDCRPWNCVVLIPFNSRDPESLRSEHDLEKLLRGVFQNCTLDGNPSSFRTRIDSHNNFVVEMHSALARLEGRVFDKLELVRKAEGVQVVTRPQLTIDGF